MEKMGGGQGGLIAHRQHSCFSPNKQPRVRFPAFPENFSLKFFNVAGIY